MWEESKRFYCFKRMENKKEEKVILIYGDNPKMSSGCAQIWDNLMGRLPKLKPKWKFLFVGWQNYNRPFEIDGYTMLPSDGVTPYSYTNLLSNIKKYNPNFFISMLDIGTQGGYIEQVNEARKSGWLGKWIAYSYLDTHDWEMLNWDEILSYPDINLVMSDFAEQQFTKHNVPNVKKIYAGVDTKVYYPLSNREDLRKKYGINDKFVIGFVGRNQRRKMLPALIKGFSQFSKDKNDVLLLLHTEEKQGDFDVNCLTARFEENDENLREKIQFIRGQLNNRMRQLIMPEEMNVFYNLMDVYCHASGGEGFGLPVIEALSCGVPVVYTDCSTAPELTNYGKVGFLLPVLEDKYGRKVSEIGANGVGNYVPDDKELANILNKLYDDWKTGGELLKKRGELSRRFALKYDWDIIAKEWISLLENE